MGCFLGNKFNVTFFMISDFPSQRKLLPPAAPNPSPTAEHRLVHNEGYKYRLCVQCQFHKIKTKSGWRVYTHFKCEKCNVPLCRDQGAQKRDCFVLYHRCISESGIKSDSEHWFPSPSSVSLNASIGQSVHSMSSIQTTALKPNSVPGTHAMSANPIVFPRVMHQRFPPYPYTSEFPFKFPPDAWSSEQIWSGIFTFVYIRKNTDALNVNFL